MLATIVNYVTFFLLCKIGAENPTPQPRKIAHKKNQPAFGEWTHIKFFGYDQYLPNFSFLTIG